MKTLIKRLFGIQRLEDELTGVWAELEATNLALLTERLMRKDMMDARAARFGPWKAKKKGGGFYRTITYPNSAPTWRRESAASLPPHTFGHCECEACQGDAIVDQMNRMMGG